MSATGILLVHAVIFLAGSLVAGIIGTTHQAASFAAGAAVMGLNWSLLGWAWARILQKKSIALAASVIVLKYALLGACLLFFLRQGWIDRTYLAVGVMTVLPTAIISHRLKRET